MLSRVSGLRGYAEIVEGLMRTKCVVEPVTDRAHWDELFSRVEQPHLPQSWAFGEAVEATVGRRPQRPQRLLDVGGWRARRIVFERNGEPVAICQLLEKSLAGLRVAALVDRGPLMLDADPSEEVVRDVYQTLRRARRYFGGLLILVPPLPEGTATSRLLGELGFRPRRVGGYRSTRVDLRPGEEGMLNNLRTNWRRNLKSGQRSRAVISQSNAPKDMAWMVDRHIQNMRERGFDFPAAALVQALYDAAPDDFRIFRAAVDGEFIAGMCTYRFGQVGEYYVGWVSEAGRKTNVNNVLFWQAALDLRSRGCHWLDLSGMRAGATEPFKTGMGGTEYQFTHNWLAY